MKFKNISACYQFMFNFGKQFLFYCFKKAITDSNVQNEIK